MRTVGLNEEFLTCSGRWEGGAGLTPSHMNQALLCVQMAVTAITHPSTLPVAMKRGGHVKVSIDA